MAAYGGTVQAPAQQALGMTGHYLAEQMLRADDMEANSMRWLEDEKAERWAEYRERVAYWRYLLIRRSLPTRLVLCPDCGAVHQPPIGTCFACAMWGAA